MTLAELVARYRVAAHDIEVPGFCSDEEICDYLNEAQDDFSESNCHISGGSGPSFSARSS